MIFTKKMSCGLIVVLSFCSVVMYLIPLSLNWKLPLPSDVRTQTSSLAVMDAIKSNAYLISLVSSASMSIHMLVDLFGHGMLSNRKEFFIYRDSLSNLIILISLLIPDFIQLTYVIPYHDPLAFHIVHRIRNVLILFATFGFLSIYGGKVWRSLGILIAIAFANIGFILKFYSYFMSQEYFLHLSIISACLLAIGTIVFFCQSITWIKGIVSLYRSQQKISTDEYCCNVYLIAFWMSTAWFWSLALQNGQRNWYEFTTNSAVQLNMIFAAYYILIAVFQRHAAIRDAVICNVSAILYIVYVANT